MATGQKSYVIIVGFLAFIHLLFPILISAQSITINETEIPDASVKNYRLGLRSENSGVIMSCLYFAGKYKIHDFSDDILEVINFSDNTDICKMAVWSLFQIGDVSYCDKVSQILESHPSEELRNCCSFLKKIKDYDTEVVKTIQMAVN